MMEGKMLEDGIGGDGTRAKHLFFVGSQQNFFAALEKKSVFFPKQIPPSLDSLTHDGGPHALQARTGVGGQHTWHGDVRQRGNLRATGHHSLRDRDVQ